MYDEAGVSFGGPSGGGITSADLGGGPSFGGDSGGYDNSVVFQPTTAALGALGPARPGDSGITTILNNVRGFLGNSPIVSRGIGGLLGSILGNVFLPGFGGLLGGYLGQQKAQNYVDRYNLNKEAMSDLLGGKLNNVNIFGKPEGVTKTRSAIDFIDPTKTISGDYLDIRDRISGNTGYGKNQIDLVKNYGRDDLEKLGAKDRTILGPNNQLEELQNYYNAVQQLSGPGSKFAPNDPARARDFITNQSKQLGGSYNIDMDLIPQDFLQTQEDLQQQKSPYSLFDI